MSQDTSRTTFVIRCETPADARHIAALTARAFAGAPHTSHTEHYIVNALREAGQLTVSLVAECAGELIGHVAVSPVSVSDGTKRWFGLGPVSVLPQEQGRGVGSHLIRTALDVLRARGACGCVVLGEPRFYLRFGFRAEPDLVLPGVPAEYFLAQSFGASYPRGTVSYDEAFKAER
jgi:predicted N-acetyltransferase YhbS